MPDVGAPLGKDGQPLGKDPVAGSVADPDLSKEEDELQKQFEIEEAARLAKDKEDDKQLG